MTEKQTTVNPTFSQLQQMVRNLNKKFKGHANISTYIWDRGGPIQHIEYSISVFEGSDIHKGKFLVSYSEMLAFYNELMEE